MYTRPASFSGHHLTRVGTEVGTSMNGSLVLGDRCPLYISMGTDLKGAPCATDKDIRSARRSPRAEEATSEEPHPLCIEQLLANNGRWVQKNGTMAGQATRDRKQDYCIRSGSSGLKNQALNKPQERSSGPARATQETFQNKK